jgi:hypothetical protein
MDDTFRETIKRTTKDGCEFSITIDRFDAGRNPLVREVATEKLERAVLYGDLSQLNEWQLRKWCEENEFQKNHILVPEMPRIRPSQYENRYREAHSPLLALGN